MIDTVRRAMADFFYHRYLHGICAITIALSVFIVCAFGLFLINAGELMAAWQKGVRVIAYLKPDVTTQQRKALMEEVRQYQGVAGVEFVSSAEAFGWLKKQIGRQSSLLDGLSENPLPDAVEVRLADRINRVKRIDALAGRLATRASVAEVEYAKQWLHRFNGIYNLFKLTGLVLIGLVFMAIMMIVANTIRLILYSRREEMEITRIIGAEESFIKYPLYIQGGLLGFCGGVVGLGLLYLAFITTMPQFGPSGGLVPFFQVRFLSPLLMALIVLASMTVGWLGCFFSIRRFLNM